MRTLLAKLLSPCLMGFALLLGAFAMEDYGIPGRLIGTVMTVVALWLPDLLIASGWSVRRSTAKAFVPAPSKKPGDDWDLGPPRPWWRTPYTLNPPQMLSLGGLGGFAIGCGASIYLNETYLRSLLILGGGCGLLGIMVTAAIRLMDDRHPHHGAFEATVRHSSRFLFVALFALGVWQALPALLVVMVTGALCAMILFTLAAIWSLALASQAAIHSSRYRSAS